MSARTPQCWDTRNHAELLQGTLDEEGETDNKLTTLAERVVNIDAAIGGESRQRFGTAESYSLPEKSTDNRKPGSATAKASGC